MIADKWKHADANIDEEIHRRQSTTEDRVSKLLRKNPGVINHGWCGVYIAIVRIKVDIGQGDSHSGRKKQGKTQTSIQNCCV